MVEGVNAMRTMVIVYRLYITLKDQGRLVVVPRHIWKKAR
jgi:hypothetical protein